MKLFFRVIGKTLKWILIAIVLYLVSLLFREERLPAEWVALVADRLTPTNIVFHADSVSVGLRQGVCVRGFRAYDLTAQNPLLPLVAANQISIFPIMRHLYVDGLRYARLPDGYYAPGNHERNAPVEGTLPNLERWSVELTNPNILGIAPREVVTDVEIADNRLTFDRIRLDWPDEDEKMSLTGFCYVDLARQEVYGEIDGLARQSHIRPLLVALDIPVSLPYFDGFTEVPGSVPSWCSWRVNLVNNDFDLGLKLHPKMGRYNGVPMCKADGDIHLHVYTRGTNLNYRQTFGPITGVGVNDETLRGTVLVSGTNGYNTVDVEAESTLATASLLRIGGFVGDYVGRDVVGNSSCKLQFRFPRAMTNNYEVLNGYGHLSVKDGHIMRMKGMAGLVELLAKEVPGFSALTDSTQASCDYVIEDGIIKTENIYIEGTVFSIKMFGQFDAVHNELDFTARVQFTKKDSLSGKILHPLALPFTKLLLEFKLTGTAEKPEWHYISVLERILEVVK